MSLEVDNKFKEIADKFARVKYRKMSFNKRANALECVYTTGFEKMIESLENISAEEYLESLSPLVREIHGRMCLGKTFKKINGRRVRYLDFLSSSSKEPKILLLEDVIEEEFEGIKDCEGKKANLTIVPYWNYDYEYRPTTLSLDTRILKVESPLHNSQREPYLYYEHGDKNKKINLLKILLGEKELCDSEGGIYKIKIIDEGIEFPSKRLLQSFYSLYSIISVIENGTRGRRT